MEEKSLKKKKKILEDLWEKQFLKSLRKKYFENNYYLEHIEKMEEQEIELNEKIKKENDTYEKLKKQMEEEKNKAINLIELNKKNTIEENKKKYRDLISYLETIKNNKEKLIEFFNKSYLFQL